MKLARTVAHTLDVDGMLDSITTEQFSEWLVAYKIEPWGIELTVPNEAEKKPSQLAAMRSIIGV